MARSQEEVDLEARLTAFRQRCDPSDPQQAAMLAEMEEHTRRLRQARREWEAAANRRNWNSPAGAAAARNKPPLADEAFRAYKEHVTAEQQRQRSLGQREAPLLLDGGCAGSGGNGGRETGSGRGDSSCR